MAKNISKSFMDQPDEEQTSESYISIGLGLLVVVVVGILLYNYFTQKNATQNQPTDVTQEASSAAAPGSTYTVAAGDTLWSIAEKAYNDGYKWTDIAKANNIQNTDSLETGQQLSLPDLSVAATSASPEALVEASPVIEESQAPTASPIAVTEPTTSPTPAASEVTKPAVTITGTTYTVVKGDTLWDIACRAYGDCYAWVRIAEANKLANPSLIHPGNEFALPR